MKQAASIRDIGGSRPQASGTSAAASHAGSLNAVFSAGRQRASRSQRGQGGSAASSGGVFRSRQSCEIGAKRCAHVMLDVGL